ncbi:MAG TPA: pitrilysin family protein [Bacilli bacterium]
MIRNYEILQEKVCFEKLENGLSVYVVPKPGFKKTFACFATKYGALINRFVPYGENDYIDVPLGIAHFLEHKMFEMPDGTDAAELFAKMGLDANASTSHQMTAYIFSGTDKVKEGLDLLLDFVQTPYFTEESVLKEQGIIAQELKMYMDDPNDALHLGLMKNLFRVYPLRYDVGGTLESIMKITPEYISKCYQTFYHPSNMALIIVGDTDKIMETTTDSISALIQLVRENQAKKTFNKPLDIRKNILVEDGIVNKATDFAKMDISVPKVAVGVKLPFEKYQKNEALLMELKMRILLEATIGPMSDAFQEMLDLELINGNLYYDVYCDGICGFVKVQANSNKPKQFSAYIRKKLLSLNKINFEEEVFNRFKKATQGDFLRAMNSPEYIGYNFLRSLFSDSDLFETIEHFSHLKIEEMHALEKYFKAEAISDYLIIPKNMLFSKIQ